jgi:Trp operon repressor
MLKKMKELLVKGHNQYEISEILQISEPTISRDAAYFRSQSSKDNIKKYIGKRLPEEYEKCLVGLTEVLKEA